MPSSTGYAAGTRYGIRARRRRPARRRRARRAAHLDGRQGRRLGGDAADRQAGRDPGAVAQRALAWRGTGPSAGRDAARGRHARLPRSASGTRPRGCLFDVVDVDHQPGRIDDAFRPNQIFAVGGLPLSLLDDASAPEVVDAVESRLCDADRACARSPRTSPATLPPTTATSASATPRYHQGTVWPWLIGPFVEAWVRVRGATADTRREARATFLEPLLQHLPRRAVGHAARDRRRRAAARAARLSVPGVVGRRSAPSRSCPGRLTGPYHIPAPTSSRASRSTGRSSIGIGAGGGVRYCTKSLRKKRSSVQSMATRTFFSNRGSLLR